MEVSVKASVATPSDADGVPSRLTRLAARLLRGRPLADDDPAAEAVMREVAIELLALADAIRERGPAVTNP